MIYSLTIHFNFEGSLGSLLKIYWKKIRELDLTYKSQPNHYTMTEEMNNQMSTFALNKKTDLVDLLDRRCVLY